MADQIFQEVPQNDIIIRFPSHKIVLETRTRYQEVAIVDTRAFGRALFLDGVLNSSAYDEFIYHEAIVHPAMVRAGKRDSVLIIGGAEGGTLREVLKYDDVKRVEMVDIDGELLEICREHLSSIYGDPWSDPRASVVVGDGREFLNESDRYDVIILDLNEAEEGTPAQKLYTLEFYRMVHDALTEGGVAVAQAEWLNSAMHFDLTTTHRQIFGGVQVMEAVIPSFMLSEAFNLLAKNSEELECDPDRIDRLLREKEIDLRYYNGDVDRKMSTLPPYLQKIYQEGRPDRTLFTDDEPGSFHSHFIRM